MKIVLEPQPENTGLIFENKIVGGVIPKEYIPAVHKGIEEAMANGVLAGYPMVGMRVRLIDGSYHDVDSSEMAFKIAGSMAFKEAARQRPPGSPRADHGRRGGRPGRVHGGRDRGSQFAARQDRRHVPTRSGAGRRRQRAAFGDVRLRHATPVADAGARGLHDAVRALRAGSGERGGRPWFRGPWVADPRAALSAVPLRPASTEERGAWHVRSSSGRSRT